MIDDDALASARALLGKGMVFAKCRRCGCMRAPLEALASALPSFVAEGSAELQAEVARWLAQLEPVRYACLGCKYCYGAEVTNVLDRLPLFPPLDRPLSCAPGATKTEVWPAVPGEYFVLGQGPSFPIAVSTLGSVELAQRLVELRPDGLCLVGKTETENIGIDKAIKNTVANPYLRFLVLAGRESSGHESGQTLLALVQNGVDAELRVVGAKGRRPLLRNVTQAEVAAFRHQVGIVDLIGCEDPSVVVARIGEISLASAPAPT